MNKTTTITIYKVAELLQMNVEYVRNNMRRALEEVENQEGLPNYSLTYKQEWYRLRDSKGNHYTELAGDKSEALWIHRHKKIVSCEPMYSKT